MPSTLHRAHAAWVGCASLAVTIVAWCSVVHAFHDSDDWLLDTLPAPATLTPVGPCRLALSNGLLSRVFAVPGPGCDQAAPNWATCECACVRASACSTFSTLHGIANVRPCVRLCAGLCAVYAAIEWMVHIDNGGFRCSYCTMASLAVSRALQLDRTLAQSLTQSCYSSVNVSFVFACALTQLPPAVSLSLSCWCHAANCNCTGWQRIATALDVHDTRASPTHTLTRLSLSCWQVATARM